MSMLDGFFNKGFKGAKCKTLLKLTIPRIKLLRNRREIQLKQMRRDIAKLLKNGQEATARIRVEHIIREENMMAAQEIIELFCELIAVRLPIIETQRECPLDLKEAISSICFAAPRCSDLPELQQVQMLFAAKYGKEFVQAAAELMPDCGVNRQVIELLSVRAPSVEVKMKLLKEIAEEHELDWDPAASESEFLKPHEDLLNGPNHFISGSTLPLPQEKHDESVSSSPVKESDEETDKDIFESLDLPEVPRVAVRGSSDTSSTTGPAPVQPAAQPDQSKSEHGAVKSISLDKDTSHVPYGEPDEIDSLDASLAFPYVSPKVTLAEKNKQFIPFVSSPSLPSASLPVNQSEPPSSVPKNKSESNLDSISPPSVLYTVKQSEATPSYSRTKDETYIKQSEATLSYSQTKDETNVDLQDVLAAAHAAAESAERAAAAARAAASLAQVRISELVTKRSDKTSGSSDNESQMEHPNQQDTAKPKFDQQSSFGHTKHAPYYEPTWNSESPTLASVDVPKMVVESLDSEQAPEHLSAHQPQRLSSFEDDPYFSYPNLFTSQDSGLKPAGQSFT